MKQQSEPSKVKIVCFGEILMRLAAPRPQMLLQRDIHEPMTCGAKANFVYDRAASSFAELDPTRIDWSKLLERAEWLFAGGITAALGDGPITALRDAFAAAREAGTKIAFDTNDHSALWEGREADAAKTLREFSLQSDLLVAGTSGVKR